MKVKKKKNFKNGDLSASRVFRRRRRKKAYLEII